MDFRKLAVRSISGLIYVGIIIGCILIGFPGVLGLSILFAILATLEYRKMITGRIVSEPATLVFDLMGVILVVLAGCPDLTFMCAIAWLTIYIFRSVTELYLKSEKPLSSLAKSLFGQIYIGIPLALMNTLCDFLGNTKPLLAVFLMIWISDTGAFIVGSLLGRHRLFERISPKKSWEGFWGAAAFNLIAAVIFWKFCNGFFDVSRLPGVWVGLGLVITVFATWGDLIESMFKRALHIKDSGNMIPGHGGILDRIDSLLLVMPSVIVFFMICIMLN